MTMHIKEPQLRETLLNLFITHKHERICVVATTCAGKSTLCKVLPDTLDMDTLIFPLLSEDEKNFVCQSPWTEEIGNTMNQLVRTRIIIRPGYPVLGTVIIDCDYLLFLEFSEEILTDRTRQRGVTIQGALGIQSKLEQEFQLISINKLHLCIS